MAISWWAWVSSGSLNLPSPFTPNLYIPVDWRRPRGRPRQSWLRTIESDLKPLNLGLHSALRRATDRPSWRRIVVTAMLFERATWWWGWCCISIWDWLTENFHVLPRSITPNLPHLSCIKTMTRRFSHSIIELIDRLRNRPWSSVPRGHLLHVGGQVRRLLGCWTDENTASPRGNADNTHTKPEEHSTVFYSCTGCRYAGVFSSSCVPLCTVCIMAELQPTSTMLSNLWIVEWCDLVFALKIQKTIMFHKFAPNLVNVHFPMQDQLFGTIYRWISGMNITRFKNILKTYFLDSHLTY